MLLECICNMDGSLNNICVKSDCKCSCKEGVEGANCTKCQDSHWQFQKNIKDSQKQCPSKRLFVTDNSFYYTYITY